MSRYNPGDLVSGKYRIVRLIGDGGMGVVYEARHEVLGSSVALKFLHAELAKRPGLTQRFLQEARVSATIQSPHVTRVTDVDTAQDGAPYLVMELLSGQSLQALLDWQQKLPVEQAVDFGLQILAGLEAAHAMGVVHRDMKPDNVFVTQTGGGPLLKLIDFGIAKLRVATEASKGLTRAGVVMGTPEYMAPEQLVSAHTTDHRADIYSLGVMLFEMLAGCRPADGDDVEVIVAAVEGGRVRRLLDVAPTVPPGLAALVERATHPDREQRFQSASEMRLALAHFAGPLSHAGRLAAVAPPLEAAPVPPSVALSSLTPHVASAPVPKTVPPAGPPLSVSQLGAARTSLSESPAALEGLRAPQTGTEMGGVDALGAAPGAYGPPPGYGPPPYGPPPGYGAQAYAGAALGAVAAPHPPRTKGRAGLWAGLLALVVIGGGGAVGYAAYRAADRSRVVRPPLPSEPLVPATTSTVTPIEAETPDFSSPLPTSTPDEPKAPTGSKPNTGSTPVSGVPTASGGSSSTGSGPVVIGAGGSTTIQFPFPIPSAIQIPTALPSSIQLPPGLTFPPGFPGVPQPAPTSAPTPTPTATPAPTSATPDPTPTTTPTTPSAPRTRPNTRP